MHKKKHNRERIQELTERCLCGDEAAWNEFFTLTGPLISYTVEQKFRRLGFRYDRQDIENIRQNIHLSLWNDGKLGTIKEKEKIIPWLCAYATYSASNYVRDLKPFDPPNAAVIDDSVEGNTPLPSDELLREDIRRQISLALASLGPKEKIIIKLLFFYEKNYLDIAQILKMPLDTVYVYAHRARSALRKKLKDLL